jgi:hypothetical protein
LGGKSVLAAHLAECLPYAVEIETIDDLSRGRSYWLPEGPGGRVAYLGTGAMMRRATQIWRTRTAGVAPTILVVARFPTPADRQLAKIAARSAGLPFLFVEARSHDERALRRIPMSFLSREDLRVRLARYDAALRAYRPVGAGEAAQLPAVCLARVQADLRRVVGRVLEAW